MLKELTGIVVVLALRTGGTVITTLPADAGRRADNFGAPSP